MLQSKNDPLLTSDQTPPRIAWAMVALSFICLAIIWTIIIDFAEFTRKSASLESLKKSAESVDYAGIEDATRKTAETTGLAKITSWFLNRPTDMPVDTMLTVVEATKQVELNQFNYAIQLLDSIRGTLAKPYDPEIDQGNSDTNDPLALTRKQLTSTTALLAKRKVLNTEIENSIAEKHAVDDEIQNFAHEILMFFSLPSTRVGNKIEFYQAGILKDLPKFSGIPDKIEDLPKFAKILETTGGAISAPEGSDAHQFFLDKLQEFHDRAFSFNLRSTSVEEKLNSNKALLEKSQKDLQELKQYTKSTLIFAVVNSCENQLILNYPTAHSIRSALKWV